jgi:hypothetical protein
MPKGIYKHKLNQGFQKFHNSWNKGRKKVYSKESLEKMSVGRKGMKFSEEHKKNLSLTHKGYKHPLEIRLKMSKTHKERKEQSHLWKGGITPINSGIRKSLEYKLWRTAVFERDNYTCLWCGFKGYVEADHIKPFYLFPELRFAIDNGRTLCRPCHMTTETWGRPRNNWEIDPKSIKPF